MHYSGINWKCLSPMNNGVLQITGMHPNAQEWSNQKGFGPYNKIMLHTLSLSRCVLSYAKTKFRKFNFLRSYEYITDLPVLETPEKNRNTLV